VVGLEQRPAGGTGVPGLDGAEPGEEHDAGTGVNCMKTGRPPSTKRL
jgi:hypothetical protein